MAETKRRSRFLPYRFAESGLMMSVEHCTIDGHREPALPYDAERRLLDLSGSRVASVRVGLQVTCAESLFLEVFPADERGAPKAWVVVTVVCAATRQRRAVVLSDGVAASGTVRGEIEIAVRDTYGTVELTPVMVRQAQRADRDDGFATLAGSRIATGRPIELRVDKLRTPHGEYLDIRYESFGTRGPPQFPRPDALYQLDCDGDEPILWLNLDHARICAIFDAAGNVGRAARVRNVVFAQIAQAVWTRLFWRAARSLERIGESVLPWEDAVLAAWLPHVYPDVRDADSRRAALRADLGANGEDAVMARLDGALQASLEVARCAEALAGELA